MKLPSDSTKHNAKFKYVEVARYAEFEIDGVPKAQITREQTGPKGQKKSVLYDISEVQNYASSHGGTGIYTSVFQYDSTDIDTATPMGSLCFDMDSNDLEQSRIESIRLIDHLLQYIPANAINVFFSGGKGFHVECEAIALNISSSDNISGVCGFIARDIAERLSLESIDLRVYDVRRMWRLVNTRHQRTGLFKVECMSLLRGGMGGILEWAKEPRDFVIPEQEFNMKANQWYKEYSYRYEQSQLPKVNVAEMFARFIEDGTNHIKHFDDHEKVFDKFKLLKNCPAIGGLIDKAEKTHELTHYERLFLCSLLTYTQDAILFLHEIFSKCSDYNPDITTSHVEDWIKRREYGIGGRPFTCSKSAELGIACSGCSVLEPRNKVVQLTNGSYAETGELSAPSPIRFCYSIPRGNKT